MSKSNKKTETTQTEKILSIFDERIPIIPEDKRIFCPSLANPIKKVNPYITLNDYPILRRGGIWTIISLPGEGKSAVCEAIASLIINPDCDSFGFKLMPPPTYNKILYIDGERTPDEIEEAWARIHKRAGSVKDSLNIIYQGVKNYPVTKRIDRITELLKNNNDVFLIITDGIADLEPDVNNVDKTNRLYDTLMSFNQNIAFICTIHANPGENAYELKARGHVGSELLRRSQSVFTCKFNYNNECVEITASSKHGKIRKGDKLTCATAMKYDEQLEMFIGTEYTPKQPRRKANDHRINDTIISLINESNGAGVYYTKLINDISTKMTVSNSTAKRYLKDMIGINLITKDEENKRYFLGSILGSK